MNLKILFSIIFFLLFSCGMKNENRNVRIKKSDNVIYEGKLLADSLLDGKVKDYDSSGNYFGYSTFRYGKKEGVEVRYFKNGRVSDSSFYHNDMQNGFAYKFDENGYLLYKSSYLNGVPFGHLFEYDSIGNIIHYYFINFEHQVIFELYKVNGEEYRKGDEIQMNLFSEYPSKNNFLFLYLFASPFTPRHYEIGILDSNKKIVSSKKIISSECYYEQELIPLPKGYKYAVILHTYNSFKKRDDIAIEIVE
jgi:antitoxin component YwqK of YwqJK toxin-antitoxin module